MLARDFGERLKKMREERQLSQRQLASGIDVEPPHISRYERGLFMPNAETLIALARFLEVSVGQLLLGDDGAGDFEKGPKDLALWERFQELEKLERKDREVVIALIDAWVRSRQMEDIMARRRTA